ncbi:hypothetical protein CON58_06400, partial [Bacillus pseudomycoides]
EINIHFQNILLELKMFNVVKEIEFLLFTKQKSRNTNRFVVVFYDYSSTQKIYVIHSYRNIKKTAISMFFIPH